MSNLSVPQNVKCVYIVHLLKAMAYIYILINLNTIGILIFNMGFGIGLEKKC